MRVPCRGPGRLSPQASSQLVTLLNWATSPHVKRLNMAFVLVDEKRADQSERLTGNPHVASIEVPLPVEAERVGFVNATVDAATLARFSDYDATQLAALTAASRSPTSTSSCSRRAKADDGSTRKCSAS